MFTVITSITIFLSAQMFAPPSMYPWVRRANGTRAGPPGPYICAKFAVFAKKHEAIFLKNHDEQFI
jgi:hypothetical protein